MAHSSLAPLQHLPFELAGLGPRGVLLLLVSRSDCAYCHTVRQHYLQPLLRSAPPRLHLRELQADAAGTSATLRQLGVRFFPTLLFLGAEGRQLAEPLVGLDQAGFYGAYLEARLQQALDAA